MKRNTSDLAEKVVALYDEVMSYKTSQPIGSSCSKVYDLRGKDGWDFSGGFDYPVSTAYGWHVTPQYPQTAGKVIQILPHTEKNEPSPIMLRVEGDIGGYPIQTLAKYGGFGMWSIPPEQAVRTFNWYGWPVSRYFWTCVGHPARYIKVGLGQGFYVKGGDAWNQQAWGEIEVVCGVGSVIEGKARYMGQNVALNKSVSAANVSNTDNLSAAVDGRNATAVGQESYDYYNRQYRGYATVTVDLGAVYDVGSILFQWPAGIRYSQMKVTSGLTNVGGTSDLSDVWVKSPGSGYGFAPFLITGTGTPYDQDPIANLKFTARCLDKGYIEVLPWDADKNGVI